MSAIDIELLDGNNIFDCGCIPIKVLIAEHNAKQQHYHTHSFYEFVYIDRGFSNHYYNDITTLLTPGDVFGIRPGDIHGYIYPENTILYNCVFKAEVLSDVMDEIKKLAGVGQIFDESKRTVWQRIHMDPISRKEAVAILEEMRTECHNKSQGWELKLKSLLISFLVLFSRAFTSCHTDEEENTTYKYAKYMYKALAYIESNYTRSLLVEDIATYTGLSTDYFSRMFKQFTGLTPVEYIKNVRLAKAVELLRMPESTVTGVASMVGFDDPGYFARQFKQALGISPSAYQRNNKTI